MVKDTDVVYIALLKTTSLCTFAANKSHRSTEIVFSHFLIVCLQYNQIQFFCKITLIALEKYFLEIEEQLVYLCFGLA